jgi:hypothetical protein
MTNVNPWPTHYIINGENSNYQLTYLFDMGRGAGVILGKNNVAATEHTGRNLHLKNDA